MIDILTEFNKLLKSKTPKEAGLSNVFQSENLTQIIFSSNGCKKGMCGSCIMCNYGIGKQLDVNNAISEYTKIISEIELGEILLLGTYGSFLDTSEISQQVLEAILQQVSKSSASVIIIETAYDTVNSSNLQQILNILQGKNIQIEMGLESVSDIAQQLCLNKAINLEGYKEKIDLIHSFGMSVASNIVVGIPFLNSKEQLNDALETIKWVIEQGSDNVVLFPMNIKQNTLLHYLYQEGRYKRISNWLLVETLNQLDEGYLDKIILSWYKQGGVVDGIRSENRTIYPTDCDSCSRKIEKFYDDFTNNKLSSTRRLLINKLIQDYDNNCECREKIIASIDNPEDIPLRKRLEISHKSLIADFEALQKKKDDERDI